jgi:hypothetical protein
MIEQALRNFCESRHRWLIVTAGTFVLALVLVIPLVDAYCAGRNDKEALLAELESARQVAAELSDMESRVATELAQVKVFEARTTDEGSLPVLRGKLVDLAKETGCNIRRLSVGAASSRPWTPGDDPINPTGAPKTSGSGPAFILEWRPVTISLTGSSANLRTLLERIAAAGMLMHAKSLEMYASSPSRQELSLDMELWYFTLVRRG